MRKKTTNLIFNMLSQRGRKEGNVLFNNTLNTFYLVIWRRIYQFTLERPLGLNGIKVQQGRRKCFI